MQPDSDKNQLFPVMMNLHGARVVVIGGGRVALRKVKSLLECGARVVVISPQLCAGLSELADSGRIQAVKRVYQPGDLGGAVLAVAAVDDPQAGASVAGEAGSLGIPVNVVDKPELCSFIVPSVLRRGPLAIAVSTSGASPAWARRIREGLEAQFGDEYARLFEVLRAVRNSCLREIPDPGRRRAVLERLSDPAVLELARKTDPDDLEGAVRNYLGLDG